MDADIKDLFEPWPLDKGDIEEVINRGLALATFIADHATASERQDAMAIAELVYVSDDQTELTELLKTLKKMLLESEMDETDDKDWEELYTALFDSSPLAYESAYAPKDGEWEALVKKCIEDGVRVNATLPDGTIA